MSLRSLVFLLVSVAPINCYLVRRGSHSSTVVENYIYVDGGELSQIVDGNYLRNVETRTLSIPIDVSWSPLDVDINSTNKTQGVPILNSAKLWANPNAKGFYLYGGKVSPISKASVPPRGLWNFTTDGKGGGTWSDQGAAGEIFDALVRTSDGASDVLGDTAYYLGGIASRASDPSEANAGNNQIATSGLTSFNMNTGVWEYGTASGYAGIGKTSDSAMVHVPRNGSGGLLLVMGGTSIGADPSITDGINAPYMSFANISIYDPSAKTWYSQTATGMIPEDRGKFCAVGVEDADNFTYEIFIYGGIRILPEQNETWTAINNQLDEVFVLSLPKFEWTKANYTAKQNRYSHTCHVAGNRQMLSIGGVDGANPEIDSYNITDPFPQTIGVFDLTEMVWSGNYSHTAPPYQRPDAVQALYAGNDGFPSAWSSPGVEMLMKTLFKNGATPSMLPSSTPAPSATADPAQLSPPSSKSSNSINGLAKGAIAVGAIFAGVVIIALIAGVILWHRRKPNSRREFGKLHEQISRPVPVAEAYPRHPDVIDLDHTHHPFHFE